MSRRGFDAYTGVRALIDHGADGGPVVDAALHVNADAICPRCLTWIRPDDYVRQTLIGLLQHEACPP